MNKSKRPSKVYDKIATNYARDFSIVSEHIDEFLEQIPKKSGILDIGSGVGTDSDYMDIKGFKVIGIDLSIGMLKIAREGYPRLDFRQLDLRKLDFYPDSFEGVLSSFSLIHIAKKEIPKVLDKIYLLLKKSGIFYLSLQEGESSEIYTMSP